MVCKAWEAWVVVAKNLKNPNNNNKCKQMIHSPSSVWEVDLVVWVWDLMTTTMISSVVEDLVVEWEEECK